MTAVGQALARLSLLARLSGGSEAEDGTAYQLGRVVGAVLVVALLAGVVVGIVRVVRRGRVAERPMPGAEGPPPEGWWWDGQHWHPPAPQQSAPPPPTPPPPPPPPPP